MGSGEGLPEAAAGGPPACTSIHIPPSGHGLISASGIYQEMEKKRKSSEPVSVPDQMGFLLASGQHGVLSLVWAHAVLSYLRPLTTFSVYAKKAAGLVQFCRHLHPGLSAKNSAPPFLFDLVRRLPPAQCCEALLLCSQEEGRELCGPVSGEAALIYVPSWDWQPGGALPGCCSCILSWGPVELVITKSHSH